MSVGGGEWYISRKQALVARERARLDEYGVLLARQQPEHRRRHCFH